MPAFALVSTLNRVAIAVSRSAVVREPQKRRITTATGASVLLHLAALLAFGLASLDTSDLSSVPELRLFLEPESGRDPEHENSPAVERPAAQKRMLSETLASAIPDDESAEIAPPQGTERSNPPPAPSQVASETTTGDGSEHSESPLPEPSEVVSTVGNTDLAVPVTTEIAPPEPQPLEIPTSQQTMLTRQVVQWAQGFENSSLTQTYRTWQHEGKEYSAVLTRQPAADHTDIERLIVDIATEEQGKRLQTRVQMKRLAFSHFTQLVDHWDSEVQLHDDEIDGRFHSNSEIFLGYDRKVAPRFLGKVTTAARGFTIVSARGRKKRDEIFRAGLETRAGRIVLPRGFLPFSTDEGGANAQVRSFDGDTRITFYPDGSYGWQALGSNDPERREVITGSQAFLVGARKADLHVRGTVKGTVLVYSPERIIIDDDLVYAHNPRESGATDYLGLVSDKYIEIARPAVTGTGDLEVHAAIYAKRRFIVTDEQAPNEATLIIYGSLTAGTLSATEPRYATRVEFDSRFENLRPPGFPMTDRYEIEAWDAQWRQASADTDPPEDTPEEEAQSADAGTQVP